MLIVNDRVHIPTAELTFRATRAGGPGGQHVNTSSTRVELTWNVRTTSALDDAQRARVMEKLANRIDDAGVLRITASSSRSQYRNKQDVSERLAALVADALKIAKPRRKTKMPHAAREARLQSKKRRSEVKRRRGPVSRDE